MEVSTKNAYTDINSEAVIGNYLPRKCGIATFTTDLVEALSTHSRDCYCYAIAMNDKAEGYDYPEEVRFEVNQNNVADYRQAAKFINANQADIVCLQHEFGIFGGPAGGYIITLLQELHIPVVTTLHTVLANPTETQEKVLVQLADISDRLVVMSQRAVDILHSVYDIAKENIAYIPHGIPDVPFVDPNYFKEKFDLLGKDVLLTFGLLSENKGIEYVIKGLPKVVEKFPDLTYVVLGATHPHVLENDGEKYRSGLHQLVEKLDLGNHVIFENHFVPFEELCEYLAAADLYITPYIHEDQITSGTLAYALGSGKAVISTPYWYAKEMLADGRGQLVPFEDADASGNAINELLTDDAKRHHMRKCAYDFTRNATWEAVVGQYLDVFHEVKGEHNHRHNQYLFPTGQNDDSIADMQLPAFKLDHLLSLSDDTGLLQHANHTIARRDHGYCTDDNARALIATVYARRISGIDSNLLDMLSGRYLAFLLHAYDYESGRFRNFMNYSRQWLETVGSEDAHSRALWALGTAVSLSGQSSQRPLISKLFTHALETAESFQSPRAISVTIIGIYAYLETFSGDSQARRSAGVMAERLFKKFEANASNEWPWPENELAYSNARLPHALLLAGQSLQRDDLIKMGLKALDWLVNIQTDDGHLAPIGNKDWYIRGGKKARFDQQPLEANALIEACITAFNVSDDEKWLNQAVVCFNWFLGLNDLNLPLYDVETGGCRDGLQLDGINQNQGAESTLSWLLSLVAMYEVYNDGVLHPQLLTDE